MRRVPPLTPCLTGLLVTCLLAGLFWKPLFAGQLLLFRDVAHFYTPLWEWARGEWGRGHLPLWNPLQNLGASHVAENSSAVFYPGKLIFALPLPFPLLLAWFLVGHLGLAAWTMYGLARGLGRSREAAGLASISYVAAGPILFQYCNPPFLIGAAWLPWAVLNAWRLVQEPRVSRAAGLAGPLALMLLGGDAQSVYHVGLMLVLAVALAVRRQRDRAVVTSLRRWVLYVGAALVLTAGLSAVQLLPTACQTAVSARANFDQPRSLPEVWQAWRGGSETTTTYRALLGHAGDDHHRRVFQFSVGPWRWAELIWPNFSGQVFPRHQRWTRLFPGESLAWSPSLYMGLLPCLLAGRMARRRPSPPEPVAWLAWSAGFFALGALGQYGGGWILSELRCATGAEGRAAWVGWPFGGIYWALTVLLPGYVYFRYPAKLWTMVACGLSVLAAYGWDASPSGGTNRGGLRKACAGLILLSACGWALSGLIDGSGWRPRGWEAAADAIFGPLDLDGALADLQGAFGHTLCLAAVLYALLRWSRTAREGRWPRALLVLCALELGVAQRGLVPTAKLENNTNMSYAAQPRPDAIGSPPRVYRIPSPAWRPSAWQASSSDERLREVVQRNRRTSYPQYHHQFPWRQLPVALTLAGADWQALADLARELGNAGGDGSDWPAGMLDLLSMQYALRPAAPDGVSGGAGAWQQDPAPAAAAGLAAMRPRPTAGPRCWVVENVAQLPPLRGSRRGALRRRTRAIWGDGAAVPDFELRSVIESESESESELELGVGPPYQLERLLAPDAATRRGACRIVSETSQEIVMQARLPRPGLVVLCDAYDAGWRVTVRRLGQSEWRREAVRRTNRVMRGVWLSAGSYEICWRYLPRSFVVGAGLSGLSWLFLGCLWGSCLWGSRRAR